MTVKTFCCLLGMPLLLMPACKKEKTSMVYHEQHRPQFHFSQPAQWMNDPNGLVFYKGEYHMFYQHYPDSTVWGPMHWGHAVSKDLVHWDNLPIALYPDTLGYIFSGSAVIDWNNSSGLQQGGHPPLIAVFTQHSETRRRAGRIDYENQCIAYSLDMGRTFIRFGSNPVITNPGEKDFRDPKVIWYAKLQKWIMVLAAGNHVMFYGSSDLLKWEYMSEFGSEAGAHGGVWECPDLFPLHTGNLDKWILLVNINPGAPNGGSGTQYFTGEFNGHKFINDNPADTVLWLDYGPDNYAGVTWSDIPAADGRRIFIGWMNNWAYAQVVPTVGWRSAMTLPRSLTLKRTGNGLRLCINPVRELEKLKIQKRALKPDSVKGIPITGMNEIEIRVNLSGTSTKEFGLIFANWLSEELKVGYDVSGNRYFINRTYSGKTDFSPAYTKELFAPRIASDSILRMRLFLDHSSLELFADSGITSMTATFFPNADFNRLTFFRNDGVTESSDVIVYNLNRIW